MLEEVLNSCDALVGVDWVERWEKPTIGEMGVDGKLITRVFPGYDGFGESVFSGVLCILPVFDGGGGKSIIVQVAFLMLGKVFGFSESCHVCGEDSAVWIT